VVGARLGAELAPSVGDRRPGDHPRATAVPAAANGWRPGLDGLARQPRPAGCIKLGSDGPYRIRVGDYRVNCDIVAVVLSWAAWTCLVRDPSLSVDAPAKRASGSSNRLDDWSIGYHIHRRYVALVFV